LPLTGILLAIAGPLLVALAIGGLVGLFTVPFFTAALPRVHPRETGSAGGLLNAVLELIADCIARLRRTDPADTAAAVLAAWHGFGTAQPAGSLLAQDDPNDAILARHARAVLRTAAERLRAAPSLPYTDAVVEPVDGLAPERFRAVGDHLDVDLAVDPDTDPANAVRRTICPSPRSSR